MKKTKNPGQSPAEAPIVAGKGQEVHQQATSEETLLTTNQGVPIADNQNSLKAGARGPVLLQDFILREKITHFDHERIPERVVHARGSAAHGFFECLEPLGDITRAAFLQKKGDRIPVFTRFSTVAGNKGQVNYEPSSLGPDIKHESQERGYQTFAAAEEGEQLRIRPESFADHYSQARLFYLSQTEPEQNHIVFALVFELSKCVVPRVREAVLSRLIHIDESLAMRVAAALGVAEIQPAELPVAPQEMKPSPALSILAKALPTLQGRKVGCLVSDGSDDALLAGLRKAVEAAGATFEVVAPRIGGITTAAGKVVPADHKIEGAPSVLFDAVAIIPSREGGAKLSTQAEAVNFLRDAFGHLKVIAYTATAAPLLVKAGMPEANPDNDAGMISLEASAPEDFVKAAAAGRIWDREPYVRDVP